MKNKLRVYFLFFLSIVIVAVIAFFTFKFNFSRPSAKTSQNLDKIFSAINNIGDGFKNLPPLPLVPTSTQDENFTDNVIKKISDKLKTINNELNTTTEIIEEYETK